MIDFKLVESPLGLLIKIVIMILCTISVNKKKVWNYNEFPLNK